MEKYKIKYKQYFRYFIISFIGLFLFRLVYGFFSTTNSEVAASFSNAYSQNNHSGVSDTFQLSRKNYASTKKSTPQPFQGQTGSFQQKYEKIGSISSDTDEYDEDEKKIRGIIKSYKAMIQYEEMNGLRGNRSLRLGIGVNPENFDEMIREAKEIGILNYLHINKTDKTNEFKELNAQRQSLEKTKNALIALKGTGGKIQELIDLENKILEKELSIQELGVKLGEFDEENEFCTIKFLLSEKRLAVKPGVFLSLLKRLKVALEWTIKYYLYASLLLFFISVSIIFIILIIEKFFLLFKEQIVPGTLSLEKEPAIEKEHDAKPTSKKKGVR